MLFFALFGVVRSSAGSIEPNPYPKTEAAQSSNRQDHAVALGAGVPVCGIARGIVRYTGCGAMSQGLFWANVPAAYRYRPDPNWAFGAGLMVNAIFYKGVSLVSGGLLFGAEYFLFPDWLYLGFEISIGFPLLFAMIPKIGHAFELTDKLFVFVENQVVAFFIGGAYGVWQPVVGLRIPI